MRFADELADLSDFSFPASQGIRQAELKMARQLIDNLAADWDPEKYTDEYKTNLMKVIEGKLKGRKPKLQGREGPQEPKVVDLMARLKASLESRGRPETRGRIAASKSKKGTRRARKGDRRRVA
jgi:DNA end-binding protein Ku